MNIIALESSWDSCQTAYRKCAGHAVYLRIEADK